MNLTNNYAVTSGDMAEALSRYASVAQASGISIGDALSYAVGTNQSVQNAEKTNGNVCLQVECECL